MFHWPSCAQGVFEGTKKKIEFGFKNSILYVKVLQSIHGPLAEMWNIWIWKYTKAEDFRNIENLTVNNIKREKTIQVETFQCIVEMRITKNICSLNTKSF